MPLKPTSGASPRTSLKANVPEAYAVFKLGDDAAKVSAQGLKVMTFVDSAVKGIDDMGAVGSQLDTLAQRHTGYGAKKAHFGVSTALLCNETLPTFGGFPIFLSFLVIWDSSPSPPPTISRAHIHTHTHSLSLTHTLGFPRR